MSGALAGIRIGLLTASASRLGGGVFEAVVAQADLIRGLGGEALVVALEDRHSRDDAGRFAPGSVTVLPVRGPAQIGYAPDLAAVLLHAGLDYLHLHGIWMYPSRAGTLWARSTGRPYLISPHGMLDPWITARGRWKKALARAGYERQSWRAATALHALTADEARDISAATGRNGTLVIPNAAPPSGPAPGRLRAPRIVYIGRIHPKKNLLALIAGWRQARLPDGARLTLAGWGDPADVDQLRAAVNQAGPQVEFIGPVYGEDKQDLLQSARFAVLPSLSEGLPMAVLEGWAAGLPSIMTAACHLPEGFAAGAAIPCGADPAALALALEQALALDAPQWLTMAAAAQGLARGPFSAAAIAARWADTYRGASPAREGVQS
ncbi:MAG: glycosyltransferase [Novosphingobium sp.]|nr:glycosyltransferase [Novosphingobium sp.]